ncbi:hypothetical protein ACTUM1_15535, partial [Listeria monocytogenes]|uniref:hypothetical protein n=1 Tax=Listeria monocytogenes TaxID=1639 RepID=UPI003FA433AD
IAAFTAPADAEYVRIEFGADAELVEFEPYTYDATGDAISQRVSSLMAVSFDAPLTAMNIYDVSSLRPVYRWKGPPPLYQLDGFRVI